MLYLILSFILIPLGIGLMHAMFMYDEYTSFWDALRDGMIRSYYFAVVVAIIFAGMVCFSAGLHTAF